MVALEKKSTDFKKNLLIYPLKYYTTYYNNSSLHLHNIIK